MNNQTQTKLQIGLEINYTPAHPKEAFHDFWDCVDEMNKGGSNVKALYFGCQLGGFIFPRNNKT